MDDLTRLRQEYARRSRIKDNRYSWRNPAYIQQMQSRERNILATIAKQNSKDFDNCRLLEIGCGSGGVLLDFQKWGVPANHCVGIDLLYDRLSMAKKQNPTMKIFNANGATLPFNSEEFDIVLQFTALSSILDSTIRKQVAAEMLRVLRTDGIIIWYDFWINPTNPQTQGITKREIKNLFGETCDYLFRKITLAPPLAKRMISLSRTAVEVLESIRFLNTHWLVFIQKN